MEYMRTHYNGSKVHGRMEDYHALYSFPNHFQSDYKGGIQDGMFQGNGTLNYSKGVNYFGKFENGKTTEGYFEFSDGLRYEPENWKYCDGDSDRLFKSEREHGLRPAGRSQLTNRCPPHVIPDGMLDCGDGFYDPQKRIVKSYESKFLRNTDDLEHNWIVNHCRKARDSPVGIGRVH